MSQKNADQKDSLVKGSGATTSSEVASMKTENETAGSINTSPEVVGGGVEPIPFRVASKREGVDEEKLKFNENDSSDEETNGEQASGVGSDLGRDEGGGEGGEEGITDEGQVLPQAYAVDDGAIPIVLGTSVKDDEEDAKRLKEKRGRCIVLVALLALSLFIILITIGLTKGFKTAVSPTVEPGPSPSPTPEPLSNCPPEDPALVYALPSQQENDTYCPVHTNSTNNTTNYTLVPSNNHTNELCWRRIGPTLEGDRGSMFGARASLDDSGSRFAVTAIKEGSCDGNKLGVIRIYDIKSNLAFIPIGTIEGIPGDESVAVLSGDGQRLAVGFPKRDGSVDNIGGFRVFEQENVTSRNWMLLGEPIVGTPGDKPLEDSYFGYTISTDRSGSVIAVGAPRARNDIGSVFVFRFAKKNGLWEQMGEEILGPGAIQGDRFGFSLSLSSDGKILAVGQQSDHGLEGRVVAYQYKEGTWEMLGQQIRGEAIGDKFGKFLSLSADGMTLVAGAKDHANAAGTGLVRIFGFNNTEDMWMRLGSTIESKALKYKPSRFHITADGSRIALATGKATIGQGYAEVYDYDGNDWQRVGGKIPASEQTDKYGGSVEISGDGSRLLLSYATEDEGVVRIYRLKKRGG